MIPTNDVQLIKKGQNSQNQNTQSLFSQSIQYEPEVKKMGKWMPNEHQIFLDHFFNLTDSPNRFRIIAQMLGCRSSQQVRSHAQKYQQRKFRHDHKIGKRPSDLQLSKDDSTKRKTRGQISRSNRRQKRAKKNLICSKIIKNIIISGPSQSCQVQGIETKQMLTGFKQMGQYNSSMQIYEIASSSRPNF